MRLAVRVCEYTDGGGRSHFRRWFDGLDARAAAKVTTALYRLQQGNFSNAKGVGSGVYEYRIHSGPGYRLYFGKDGETLVILLLGGSKKTQHQDVENAKRLWREYKQGKKKDDA